MEQSLGVTIYTPGDQKNYLENENLVVVGTPQSIQAAEEAILKRIKEVDKVNQEKKLKEIEDSRRVKAGGERGDRERGGRKPRTYGSSSSSSSDAAAAASASASSSGFGGGGSGDEGGGLPNTGLPSISNDAASLQFSSVSNFPRLLERNSPNSHQSNQVADGF